MKKGFTLIELIVVVIIIAILSTFAVPQYLKVVERAKGGKARHNMSLIAQAEKMYRAENDTYINVGAGGANAALGQYVELSDVDADTEWTYAVSGASASAFTLTATRADGANASETVTLTEAGTWGGTFTP